MPTESKKRIPTVRLARIALCAALLAIATMIRIPLPLFSTVMFTAQVFMVLLIGLMLGAKDGAIAVGVYLIIGLCGVPIFTRGGGFHTLATAEAGYLIGFVACAAVTGAISSRNVVNTTQRDAVAVLAGLAVLYIVALPYIAVLGAIMGNPHAFGKLMTAYALAFWPLDLVKAVLAVFAIKPIRRALPMGGR